MIDEHNLNTYEARPEWFSVFAARNTKLCMSRAISRGDLRLATAMFPESDLTDTHILFGGSEE